MKKLNNETKLLDYIKEENGNLLIKFHVKTNNKKNEVIFSQNECIVYTSAPPIKGKANKSILQIFSQYFRVGLSSIELLSGHKSTNKKIIIYNFDKKTMNKNKKKL